jgi:hypothetical protein
MRFLNSMRFLVTVGLCVAVLLSFSITAGAAPGRYAAQPAMTRLLLSSAGVATEAVELYRDDDISRALHIPDVRGNDVLIGFPGAGIGPEVPFLLVVNGEELNVKVTAAGELTVLEGDPSVLPADVGDFINCLVNNIVDLVKSIIEINIGGIIGNVLQLVVCVFAIF